MGLFSKIFDDILGFDPPKPAPLPPIAAPRAERIKGKGADQRARQLRRSVSGRKNTIVTGDLSPTQVGKTSLLGRTSRA